MPSRVVDILIAKVDLLATQVATLQADISWIKKITANVAETKTDVSWFKKAAYLAGGAALSFAGSYFLGR